MTLGKEERSQKTESLIAASLTIEGKIHGTGHVRIAGSFKGEIHVQGDLTIEPGGHITGELRGDTIRVGKHPERSERGQVRKGSKSERGQVCCWLIMRKRRHALFCAS